MMKRKPKTTNGRLYPEDLKPFREQCPEAVEKLARLDKLRTELAKLEEERAELIRRRQATAKPLDQTELQTELSEKVSEFSAEVMEAAGEPVPLVLAGLSDQDRRISVNRKASELVQRRLDDIHRTESIKVMRQLMPHFSERAARFYSALRAAKQALDDLQEDQRGLSTKGYSPCFGGGASWKYLPTQPSTIGRWLSVYDASSSEQLARIGLKLNV